MSRGLFLAQMEDKMKMTFEEWLSRVDLSIQSLVGLTHDDIDDWCYRDAYEDDVSPAVAARRALSNAGFRE